MISIYKTIEDDMVVLDKIEEGCWISAIHPNEEELSFLQEETGIDLDDLRHLWMMRNVPVSNWKMDTI